MSNALLVAAEHILMDKLLNSDAPMIGKDKFGQGLIALSVLMLAIGLLLIVYGSYLWLMKNYPPEQAALLGGAISLGISVLCALGFIGFMKFKKNQVLKLKDNMMDSLQDVLETAEEELDAVICENPKAVMLATSLAGFAVGNKIP